MCGRFGLFSELDELAEQFNFAPTIVRDIYQPRWNIPPTAAVLTIQSNTVQRRGDPDDLDPDDPGPDDPDARIPRVLRWGMTAARPRQGAGANRPLFNARAETIRQRPTFRDAFAHRRCLVPANGFYEWRKEASGGKTPVWFHRHDSAPVAFAGIWSTSQTPEGPVDACAVITCAANGLVESVHDRMPIILPRDEYHLWLADDLEPEPLLNLLRPVDWPDMTFHPVSTGVNRASNNDPSLVQPMTTLL
jgi:putative SOS response-associated peptidase YedK